MSEREASERGYGSRSPPRTERQDRLQDRNDPSRGQLTERLHADSPSRHDVQFYVRKVNRYEAEISRLEQELSVTRFRLSKAEDFELKYDQLFKENQQTIIDSLEAHEQLEKNRRELDRLQHDHEQTLLTVKSLKNDLQSQRATSQELRNRGEELRSKSTSEGQEEREAHRQAHNKQVEQLKNQTREVREKLSKEVNELKNQLAHKQTIEEALNSKLNHIKKQKNQQISRLKELTSSLREEISETHCQAEQRARQARNALITETQSRIANVRNLNRLIQETLIAQINSLNDTLTKKNQEIAFLLECDKKQLEDHESSESALKTLIAKLEDKIFAIQRENELELYSTIERLKTQYNENLRSAASEWQAVRAAQESHADGLKRQIKQLKSEIALLGAENTTLERHNKQLSKDQEQSVSMLSQKIISMEAERDQSLRNYTTSMKQIEDDAKAKLDDLQTAIRNKEGQAEILTAQVNLKNGQITHLLEEISRLREANREKVKRLESTNAAEQNALNAQLSAFKRQVLELKRNIHELEARLADNEAEYQLNTTMIKETLQNQKEANAFLKARNHFLAQWCTELQRDLKAERVSNVNILHDQNISVRENIQVREDVKVQLEALKAKQVEQLKNIHKLEKARLESDLAKREHELREKKDELSRLLVQYKTLESKVGKPSKVDRSAQDEGKCRATLQSQILLTENIFNLINRQ